MGSDKKCGRWARERCGVMTAGQDRPGTRDALEATWWAVVVVVAVVSRESLCYGWARTGGRHKLPEMAKGCAVERDGVDGGGGDGNRVRWRGQTLAGGKGGGWG